VIMKLHRRRLLCSLSPLLVNVRVLSTSSDHSLDDLEVIIAGSVSSDLIEVSSSPRYHLLNDSEMASPSGITSDPVEVIDSSLDHSIN